MTNRVVRDIDIVVPQIIPTSKKILVNEDGTTTNIKFVDFDAAADGDGSENSPFNTFADFGTKFAVNDIIYVLPQDDVNVRDTVSIQLLDGQKLVSAKEGIMVSDITGNAAHNFTIKKNSSANLPKVKQILTGNNNLVQGFDVSNDDVVAILEDLITGTGIVVNDKTGNIIKNNISSNNRIGIYVKTISDQSNQIVSNAVSSNANDGISVNARDSSSNIISSNIIDGSGDDGIQIVSLGDSSNTISLNILGSQTGNQDGIYIDSYNDSVNTISNNDVDGSGRYGIVITSGNGSSNTISSNNIDGSDDDGIFIFSFSSSNNTISGNNIDGSGDDGIEITSIIGTSTNKITSNTISNSAGSNIESNARGVSNITIQNNTFSGTGGKTDVSGNDSTGIVTIDADQLNP